MVVRFALHVGLSTWTLPSSGILALSSFGKLCFLGDKFVIAEQYFPNGSVSFFGFKVHFHMLVTRLVKHTRSDFVQDDVFYDVIHHYEDQHWALRRSTEEMFNVFFPHVQKVLLRFLTCILTSLTITTCNMTWVESFASSEAGTVLIWCCTALWKSCFTSFSLLTFRTVLQALAEVTLPIQRLAHHHGSATHATSEPNS